MKATITIIAVVLLGLWFTLLSFFLLQNGDMLFGLALPTTTSELGESIGTLNGLFSAFAVILGLMAVLYQGRELKLTTKAQHEQAKALEEQVINQKFLAQQQAEQMNIVLQQLTQQTKFNKITLLKASHQLHMSEHERMDTTIKKILEGPVASRDTNLLENCKKKRTRHLEEFKRIEKELDELQIE